MTRTRPKPLQAHVLHIIPYDGIGGVEVAARSLPAGFHPGPHPESGGGLVFGKIFLARQRGLPDPPPGDPDVWTGPRASEWAPQNYLAALAEIRRRRPDLVIVSLWRSCIVAILAWILQPRLRLVAFLHLERPMHLPDRVLNRVLIALATEVWGDSARTLAARLPPRLRHKGRVISFLTERLDQVTGPPLRPRFIFWGRLHPQKGLDRALDIFAAVAAAHPDATFTVIGPDMGSRAALEAQAATLGIAGKVIFTGPMDRAQIFDRAASCGFFLQPSLTEGMAMSVVEAMQLGLIPVVSPVGEIPRYARDGETALFIAPQDRPRQIAQRITDLLTKPGQAQQMAQAAHEVWAEQTLYREDVLAACHAVLGGPAPTGPK